MNNKEFGKSLEKRTRKFAINIIRLSQTLPNTPEGIVIRNQVTKAGTSIGANYHEANKARSQADFTNKIKISEGEANETEYWLEIIHELTWGNEDLLLKCRTESKELLAMFSSIAFKLKTK